MFFFFFFLNNDLRGTISPPLRRSVWESRQSGTQAFVSVSVVRLFYTDRFKVNPKLNLFFCLFLEQTANCQNKLNKDDNVIVLSSTLQNTHFKSRIESHNRDIIE